MGQETSMLNDKADLNDIDGSTVQVVINDVMYEVSKDLPISTSLNTFIRDVAKLKGTKYMCLEGGCGVCIVVAENSGHMISVNSCLVPVFICDGWKITTIEGIGNRKMGYHTLQAALAGMNGSQCGFCSPGWVMSMYSLMYNKQLTMSEIENSFASNLCRCTGYRPILDTFKSFASDAPPKLKEKISDIEELYNVQYCKKCPKKEMCSGTCKDLEIIYESSVLRSLDLRVQKSTIFRKVLNIDDVFDTFEKFSSLIKNLASYTINGGNTAHVALSQGKFIDWEEKGAIPKLSIQKLSFQVQCAMFQFFNVPTAKESVIPAQSVT